MSYRVIVLAVLMLPLSGCTVIGGVQGALDARPQTHPLERLQHLQPDAPITFHLANGTVLQGTYQGLAPAPAAEYAAALSSASVEGLPRVNEAIEFELRPVRRVSAEFVAFRPGAIVVREGGSELLLPLGGIDRVHRANGDVLEGSALAHHVSLGRVPLQEAPAIRTDSGIHVVQLYEIDRIVRPGSPHRFVRGLALGLAIDAAVVLIFSLLWEGPTININW
jgi:hypothetical protein